MSFHAGVFYFDGRPVHSVRRAVEAMALPLAGDVAIHLAADGIGMLCSSERVWTMADGAPSPVRSPSGAVMAWDGRLDNRDDLLLRLGAAVPRDTSDPAIALSVVERWGIDGFRFLIGEWSAAVWDARWRTLHLARD